MGSSVGADWYVMGRIAESLAMKAEARRLYENIEPGKRENPTSSYRLAQLRKAKLDAAVY